MEKPVVLITGAGGRGIGAATCVRFARGGYHVVATDIVSLEATQEAVEAAGSHCTALYMDVTKKESIDEAVRRVMEIHGRVCLATLIWITIEVLRYTRCIR